MLNKGFTPETPLPLLVIRETARVEEARDALVRAQIPNESGSEFPCEEFTVTVRQGGLTALRSILKESDPAFLSLTDGEVRNMNDALPHDFFVI